MDLAAAPTSTRTFPVELCRPADPIFAIGDVHGRCIQLRKALDHATGLLDQGRIARVVFLGDIVDRGPDSWECLRMVAEFRRLFPTEILMGNHEQFMFVSLLHPDEGMREFALYNWLRNGGRWAIPHLDTLAATLETLDLGLDRWSASVASGNVLLLHAGIPAGAAPHELAAFLAQPKLDLPRVSGESAPHWAWIRGGFLEAARPWADHFVVHGHTAREYSARPCAGRINLDATHSTNVAGALIGDQVIELTAFGL